MATIYEVLRLLSAHGWRQKSRVGLLRILELPDRPGVYLYLRGRLSAPVDDANLKKILGIAGIERKPR